MGVLIWVQLNSLTLQNSIQRTNHNTGLWLLLSGLIVALGVDHQTLHTIDNLLKLEVKIRAGRNIGSYRKPVLIFGLTNFSYIAIPV